MVVDEVASFTHSLGPLAQLVEQETLNLLVVGSIPTRPTNSMSYVASVADRSQPASCTHWCTRLACLYCPVAIIHAERASSRFSAAINVTRVAVGTQSFSPRYSSL